MHRSPGITGAQPTRIRPRREWTRYWIGPDPKKPQREKPQRGLFARFFLLYRMTSGTARMLRVACYALFAWLALSGAVTVSDALSHSPADQSDVSVPVTALVVYAVLSVSCGFAAAAVDAKARRRRATASLDSLSDSAKPPPDRIPTSQSVGPERSYFPAVTPRWV
jgi:hypothetical protein